MKQAFIDSLTDIMRKKPEVISVTADMGFSVYESLQKEFPTRFINTGVTEQASASFVAGLVLTGSKVFFYAQAAFITMRCFEQVRLDLGYNFLNVKLIGVNAGFSLNQLGVSHFAQEDIGLMRLIPRMTIFSPANAVEMKWAVNEAYKINGPVYIRYSKVQAESSLSKGVDIKTGEPYPIVKGRDGLLIVSGGLLGTAHEVVTELKKKNIHLSLYSMPTIKPMNKKKIVELLEKSKLVFSLEEHSVIGGLGSALAEMVAETGLKTQVIRIGIQDIFTGVTGSIPFLLDHNGLSKNKIISRISTFFKGR